MNLRKNHYSDVIKKVLTAKVLVIGSPTINEGMFPSIAQFLSYLNGLHLFKKTTCFPDRTAGVAKRSSRSSMK